MSADLLSRLVNSVGIGFSILGAYLVATEVTNQFEGDKFIPGIGVDVETMDGQIVNYTKAPSPTKEYEVWERKKLFKMKWGLIFLIGGALLQLVSLWITPINNKPL